MHFRGKSCAWQTRSNQEFATVPLRQPFICREAVARRPHFWSSLSLAELNCETFKFGGYPSLDLLAVATRPGLSYDVPIPAATNPWANSEKSFVRPARRKNS